MVVDIGHIILQVGNMDDALQLYRDTLGFEVKELSPEWTVLTTNLGELTLYKTPKTSPLVLKDSHDTPINLHVTDFEHAADVFEGKGYKVKRRGRSSGKLYDPWGNTILPSTTTGSVKPESEPYTEFSGHPFLKLGL